MSWPTDNTLWFLFVGLIPLAYVLFVAFKNGMRETVSLRFMAVLFTWIGYHLSPWLSFLSGDIWDTYLLVPQYIDDGLLFSSLYSVLFLLGYRFVSPTPTKRTAGSTFAPQRLPVVKTKWLALAAALSLLFFILEVGGLEETWKASYDRGEGQFDVRDLWGNTLQMAVVISHAVYIVLAGMAALVILARRRSIPAKALAWLSLLIASLEGISSFSRGAGAPFLLLAYMAVRYRGRRGALVAGASVAIALFLGSVGLYQRSETRGIGYFLEAAAERAFRSGAGLAHQVLFADESSNPLDEMAPWTRKQNSRGDDPKLELGWAFLYDLNPLPSEILPPIPLGPGLSEIMETVGSTAITTPALAEIFYVFGSMGAGFGLLVGSLFGWIENRARIERGIANEIGILLCFVSIPIGLHSSARAFTRPIEYGVILYLMLRKLQPKRPDFATASMIVREQ